jgi:hypothetical protein
MYIYVYICIYIFIYIYLSNSHPLLYTARKSFPKDPTFSTARQPLRSHRRRSTDDDDEDGNDDDIDDDEDYTYLVLMYVSIYICINKAGIQLIPVAPSAIT